MCSTAIDPGQIAHHKLPPQLRLLVRVIGEAAAFRLVEHRGGTYLVVPKRVTPGHWLCELLGPQAFAALVAEYGGTSLQLPKYDSVLRQLRHQHVHELLGTDLTLAEVALATNYSMRQVINLKRQLQPDAPLSNAAQSSLFGDPPADPPAAATPEAPARKAKKHAAALPTAHNPFPSPPRNPAGSI